MNQLAAAADPASHWPVYPNPLPDETLMSWIERTGLFFGIELDWWLLTLASRGGDLGAPKVRDMESNGWLRATVCRLSGRPSARVPPALPLDDPTLLHCHFRVAYCPMCWDEDVARGTQPYIRTRWLRWNDIRCPSHSTFYTVRPPIARRGWSMQNGGWTETWRSRRTWAHSLGLEQSDRGAVVAPEDATSDCRLTRRQVDLLCADVSRIAAPDPSPGESRPGWCAPRPESVDVLSLVLSEGFVPVLRYMRDVVFDHGNRWASIETDVDGRALGGLALRPQRLTSRITALVVAAELTRLLEDRAAIDAKGVKVLVSVVRDRRALAQPGAIDCWSRWPPAAQHRLRDVCR